MTKKMGRPKKDSNAIEAFSENLNAAIAEKNLTQLEIASELGVRQSAVSAWCAGVSMPNRRNLMRLESFMKRNLGSRKEV